MEIKINIESHVGLIIVIFCFLITLAVGILIGFGVAFYLVKKLVMDLMEDFKQTIKSATGPESISETFKKFGLGGGSFRLPIH